ncbi:MAG: DsrE family protein [bacterium]
MNLRRRFLKSLAAGTAGLGLISQAKAFDEPKHRVVYQCNKADPEYLNHIVFSTGELLRKYGDDVKIIVTCFGPGLHLLAKRPGRPIASIIQERVRSQSMYGIEFHACHNTMKALKWTERELFDFAEVVDVGAADLIELQEQGYTYISW